MYAMASAATTRGGGSNAITPATVSARKHNPSSVSAAVGQSRNPEPSTAKYPAASIPSSENSKNRFTMRGAAVTPLGFIDSLCYIPGVLNLGELPFLWQNSKRPVRARLFQLEPTQPPSPVCCSLYWEPRSSPYCFTKS